MAEYIEREALRKVMQMATDDPTCPMHIAATVDQYITEAPAADVAPVRHGRWIERKSFHAEGGIVVKCSACQKDVQCLGNPPQILPQLRHEDG